MMRKMWQAFKDEKLPKDYFRVQVTVLRYLGIELYNEETFWYGLYSKILLFNTVILFTGLEMYEFFAQWGDFSTIASVTNYLLTHIMGGIETILLYMNRKKIGKLMLSLHKPPYAPEITRGGEMEASWIRKIIKITEAMYVIFGTTLMMTILMGVVEVFHNRLTKPQEGWTMAFAPMSIGSFQKRSPYFELSVVYQVFEVTVYAYIILTAYLLNSTIMGHISVQLKILANGLRKLKPRAIEMAGAEKDNEVVVDRNMNILMGQSIQHHLQVLDLAAEMENLCSNMILSVFGCSVVLMCFLLFFASLYPIGSVEFFHWFFYWWCIACQVGSFCYWGNELSLEAEQVSIAAAEIDWPGASKHIKNAIVMIIRRAQRPLYITAGKFVPLSMETLMSIVKGSFSYYMVLQQTQEDKDMFTHS